MVTRCESRGYAYGYSDKGNSPTHVGSYVMPRLAIIGHRNVCDFCGLDWATHAQGNGCGRWQYSGYQPPVNLLSLVEDLQRRVAELESKTKEHQS